MKIIKLIVESFKGIKCVTIEPKGNIVAIEGANAQGKTSVLDAIETIFRSGHYLPDLPVRIGADSASIIAEIGDGKDKVILEKQISSDRKVKLKVTKNGEKYSKPQEMLDDLCKGVSFDPFEFLMLKPMDRVEKLKQALGIDFSELDKELEYLTKVRLEKFQTKQGAIHNLKKFEGVEEQKLPDITEIRKELEDAKAYNRTIDSEIMKAQQNINQLQSEKTKIQFFQTKIEHNESSISQKEKEIEKLKGDILRLQEENLKMLTDQKEFKDSYDPKFEELSRNLEIAKGAEKMDTKPLQDMIDNYVQIDKQNNLYRLKLEAEQEALKAESEWRESDEKVNSIYNLKREIIGKAEMPLEGMVFDKDTITINGVPLEQVNTATQMQLSIDIAMRVNPTLRVIRIKNGSLLDDERMKILETMAYERDYQIFVEVIAMEKTSDSSFYIEDGEVK